MKIRPKRLEGESMLGNNNNKQESFNVENVPMGRFQFVSKQDNPISLTSEV